MTDNGAITWTNEKRKLSELTPWPRNPRQIKVDQVKRLQESLDEFGQPETIAIGPGNELYNGHQRLKSWADKFGDIDVDVRVSNRPLSEKEREKLTVFLHKGAAGEWDFDILANEFEVDDLLDWGFEEHDLDLDLWGVEPEDDPGAQIDRAEELRELWGVESGQLWRLGEHRLICGDCTDTEVVDRLMGGEKAKLSVTSPPYGVGKNYETKGIGSWFETVRPALANSCENSEIIIWNIGDLYATGSQFIEPTFAYILSMFSEHGFRPIWIRIWLKQGANYGVGPYHLVSNKPVQQFEYLGAFSQSVETETIELDDFEWVIALAKGRHKFVKRLTKSERRLWGYSGIWRINTVRANDDHPAMFPLELPERCLKMHSDLDDPIYEPFSGAGTTLIACERLGRKCRAVEISPAYCAVAIQRWVDMTSGEPELVE